jgi:hypothetical protein
MVGNWAVEMAGRVSTMAEKTDDETVDSMVFYWASLMVVVRVAVMAEMMAEMTV